MEILDLLNESTEMFVEATNIGLTPDMSSIIRINNEALEESFALEVAMVSAANKMILSEGAVMLNEGIVGNIFEKIKTIIKKMWQKIKEFFKRVKLFFDKLIMKESKFAASYKAEILKISSVEIEGYEVKPDAISINDIGKKLLVKIGTETEKSSVTDKPTSKEILNAASQEAIGEDSDEFKKGVMGQLGLDDTTTVTYSGSQIYNTLSGLNKAVAAVKKEESAVNTIYNMALKAIDACKKDDEKRQAKFAQEGKSKSAEISGELVKIGTLQAEAVRGAMGLVNVATGAKITALKTDAAQAKKAAYKGMTKKEDK